jgi:hypothetical protein
MSQLFIAQVPRNVLFSGYDNETQTNNGIILGSRNKAYSKLFNINGDDNLTTDEGSKIVNGNNNAVYGGALLNGSFNSINGQLVFITGNSNNISGTNISLLGNNNSSSSYFINKDLIINGNNNTVSGESVYVNGSNNVTQDTKYNYINGNYNIIEGGYIAPDLSGFTDSSTSSVEPLYSNNSKLYLNGDYNVIATYSNDVQLYGSYNNVGSSASNLFIIANSQSITDSNQFYIGPDKDVNIKGAVLPCNLVQDYTPLQQQDPTGVSGWMTKDDENIYVKTTNYGWRQIPFNNSFGSFYDTTIQINSTASTANKMRFNSAQVQNTVTVVNGGDIYVDYSGLYNIQFSAQFDKTDSGSDDVDIWLRYNDTDVPWTNTRLTLAGNNAKLVAAWNFVQLMTASSYFNLMWSSADTDMRIYAEGTQSNPTRPGIPSIILTVDKISSI